MRKTKIVCTLGPATNSKTIIKDLVLAGMNVARLNMSHGNHDEHAKKIKMLKEVRKEMGVPLAIMLDTRGPEVRIREFQEGRVELIAGSDFVLTSRRCIGNDHGVSVTLSNFSEVVRKGDIVLINDGLIKLEVKDINGTEVICRVLAGGVLTNNKSINIPGVELNLDYLSDVDKKDILFGIEQGVDIFSISFVGCAQDVRDVKKFLKKNKYEQATICSKIESQKGIDNLDEIIDESDALMVARGDLGVEVDFEKIPQLQKQIISKGVAKGKAVITATEMLESMISHIRPTRAEISDVANAVLDSTSAVMLSGETSVGEYPVLTVKTMARIVEECENSINYDCVCDFNSNDVDSSVAYAACELARSLHAKAIIVDTFSGVASKNVSRFRTSQPIVACTPSEKVYHQLALHWGVVPALDKEYDNTDDLLVSSRKVARKIGVVQKGDLVVQTASTKSGSAGSNLVLVERI